MPLTTRLERAFAERVTDLHAAARTALLVAAVNDSPLISEMLGAAALVAAGRLTVDVLDPAVAARLVEINETELRFRHPLIRTAIRQQASVSQRYAAHAALADVLSGQPERCIWHQAAATIGPDETVARGLEEAATRAQRRGANFMAVLALQRAAALGDGPHRAGRLLRAAELAFELGQQDLVSGLLAEAKPLDLPQRERARVTWIQESFADGIPGDASKVRSLASVAGRAGADGDRDLALKLLYRAALQCWWSDPGQEARDQVVAAAERLDVDQGDPRLLVVLAFSAPIERGAAVIERLARLAAGHGRRGRGRPARWQRRDGGRGVRHRDKTSRGCGCRTAGPGAARPAGADAGAPGVDRREPRRPEHRDPGRRGRQQASAGDEPAAGVGHRAGGSGAAGRGAR